MRVENDLRPFFFFSCSSDAFCCGWGLHQREEEEEALEIFSVLDGCLACGGRDFAPLTQFFLVHATISFFILKITHLKITLQKKKTFRTVTKRYTFKCCTTTTKRIAEVNAVVDD